MQTNHYIGDKGYAFFEDNCYPVEIDGMSMNGGKLFFRVDVRGKKDIYWTNIPAEHFFDTYEECLNAAISEKSARTLLLSKLREKCKRTELIT